MAAVAVIGATPGFAVAGAVGSGEESIAAASATQVDLVLMNVNLPSIDGLTAAARLRELTNPPVVVLVSTYDEEDFADRLARVGAAAYLAKSAFGTDVLIKTAQSHEGGGDDALEAGRRLEGIAYSPSGRLSDVFKLAQKAVPPSSANGPLWDEDQ